MSSMEAITMVKGRASHTIRLLTRTMHMVLERVELDHRLQASAEVRVGRDDTTLTPRPTMD